MLRKETAILLWGLRLIDDTKFEINCVACRSTPGIREKFINHHKSRNLM